MKNYSILAVAAVFAGFVASAHVLGVNEAKDEGSVTQKLTLNRKYDVNVTDRLHVVLEDEKVDSVLKLTGYGVRQNILGTSYVVRSYVEEGSSLTEEDVLDELKAIKIKALRLNIVFPLKSRTLRDKFIESLKSNGINAKTDTAIKDLMDKLVFDVSPGDTIDFVSATRADGSDAVYILVSTQKDPLVGAEAELGLKFWKIWFGTPVDADMGKVKKALITGKN